jgi:hypothetical protein
MINSLLSLSFLSTVYLSALSLTCSLSKASALKNLLKQAAKNIIEQSRDASKRKAVRGTL